MSKIIKLQGTNPDFIVKPTDPSQEVNFVIEGNLTVDGTQTIVNTETLEVADNSVVLNSNFTTGVPSEDAGVEVLRGDENTVRLQWIEGTDQWEVSLDDGSSYEIIHRGNTGTGSGLDADTVDGYHGAEFAALVEDETIEGEWQYLGTNVIMSNTALDFRTDTLYTSFKVSALGDDFRIQRHNGVGVLVDTPLEINWFDGTITVDTPAIEAVDDLELVIKSGSASAVDTNGQDLVLQPGAGNGTGVSGDVVIGDPSSTLSIIESPNPLTISSLSGNVSVIAASDLIMQGLTYPNTDGNQYEALTTDGSGNITFQSVELDTILGRTLSTANNIIKMNSAGTAWEYVIDFRTVVQDPAPQLGGNLDVNGRSITGDIILDPTTNITVDGGIKATDDLSIEISAGDSVTNGGNLTLSGGTGTTSDGIIIVGTATSDATLKANTGDMILDVEPLQSVIIGSDSGSGAVISGPDENDLTLKGGDAVNPSLANGGDLILRGGDSANGVDGRVIIQGDVVFQGNTSSAPAGASYPINFFIHDLLTTGLNNNAVMDSVGIVENITIQGSGHVSYATVAPTTSFSYVLNRIRAGVTTQIGTVSYTANNKYATTISIFGGGLADVDAEDILQIVNPGSADSAIDNITITLRALTR